jgi:putative transposase
MKKKTRQPRLEDLIPDNDRREDIKKRLYNGDAIVGRDGIFTDLLQALINASLEGEMEAHLTSDRENAIDNRRNGHNHKAVNSRVGNLEVRTPRDRAGKFEPELVKKWERELHTGMDEVILSLYSSGNSVEGVRRQLQGLYGVDVSAGTISEVTNRVWSEVLDWQQRPLQVCYVIVYLDAIHYKVREEGKVVTKAIYTVYGVDTTGERDVLGLYLYQSEGARQWGLILEDLRKRGVEDVIFFCVDGLKGFKEVIEEVFPNSIHQRCIVHMVRSSVRFVGDKHLKEICSDLRKIYTSANRPQAETALESFKGKWDDKYPEVSKKWEESWEELMQFLDYSENIRRMIYTTNPVEALHRIMRKTTKTKGAWSNDKGLLKQLYLCLVHNEKSWKRKAFNWKIIQRELLDQFGERYGKHL